jgi:hypothetical protein
LSEHTLELIELRLAGRAFMRSDAEWLIREYRRTRSRAQDAEYTIKQFLIKLDPLQMIARGWVWLLEARKCQEHNPTGRQRVCDCVRPQAAQAMRILMETAPDMLELD